MYNRMKSVKKWELYVIITAERRKVKFWQLHVESWISETFDGNGVAICINRQGVTSFLIFADNA